MKTLLWKKRIIFMIGIFLVSLGTSFLLPVAHFGMDAWEVTLYGLTMQFGYSFGTWNFLISFLLLATTCLVERKLPRWGTYADMVLYGGFVDLLSWMQGIPAPSTFLEQITYFLLGVLLFGLGGGMYMSASFGSGPLDGFLHMVSQRMNLPFGRVYLGFSLLLLMVGFALHAPINIGTLFMALTVGKLYEISRQFWTSWFVAQPASSSSVTSNLPS